MQTRRLPSRSLIQSRQLPRNSIPVFGTVILTPPKRTTEGSPFAVMLSLGVLSASFVLTIHPHSG